MMTNQSVHHLKKEQVLDMILLTDTDQKKAIIDHLISLSGKNKELATLVTGWIESIHEGYLRVGTFNNRLFQDRPVDSGPLDWQTTLTIDSIAKHKEPRSLLDKLRIQEQSNRDKDKKARFLLETCRRKSLPIRQDGAHTVTDAQKAKIAERIDTAHTMPGELFTL